MSTSYHKLFRITSAIKAPRGLSERVMARIETYEVRRLRTRAAFHGMLVFLALILCVPVINSLTTAVAQTGFGEYLSLAFSDSGYVFSNLKEFVLTLADTLPAAGTIAILAVGAVFIASLRGMFVNLASLSSFRRNLA